MNNKIKILLIDDNPFCKSSKPEDTTGRELLKQFLGIGDNKISEIQETDYGFPIYNINISGKNKNLLKYFDLKWLYSTSSIKNYFNLTNVMENVFGSSALGVNGYIPDIVVFDYALTGNEENQPKGYRFDFINKKLNPNYKLEKIVIKEKIAFGSQSSNFEWSTAEKNKDRLGLFAGGIIVERFRHNTPCFGIPATYWDSINLKKTEAGFFEWFLSGALRDVFSNPNLKGKTEEQKSWQIILDAGIREYRGSIIELIRLGKIHIDLIELMSLLNGEFLVSNGERSVSSFSFETIYGKRDIPLDGLFIDKEITSATEIPKELDAISNKRTITERDVEIWNFLTDVVKIIIEKNNNEIKQTELAEAIKIADNLIKAVNSYDFRLRLSLSHYHSIVKSNLSLDAFEAKMYNLCKEVFNIETIKVKDKKNGDYISKEVLQKEEYCFDTSFNQLQEESEKLKRKNTGRFVVFFMCVRLWKIYNDYMYSIEEGEELAPNQNLAHFAKFPPNKNDLLLFLYPFWSNDVILFNGSTMDKGASDAMKSRLTKCGIKWGEIVQKHGVDPTPIMNPGEHYITQAYASHFQFKSQTYIPGWLK